MTTDSRAEISHTRRSFLKVSALVAAGLVLPRGRVHGAHGDIRVAVIGLGGKGRQHVELFGALPGVRVVGVCDVDPQRVEKAVDEAKKRGHLPESLTDPRRVLDRSDVDAVVIATPNHWHALLTLWALQAGKDVYVEKPVSHNLWEGPLMVEAARAKGRVVQAGTQYRSCPGLRAAAAWLNEGHVGKPQWAQVVWYEHRPAIGRCAPFTPTDVDYNLWCGPAPLEPLTRPKLHYDWHWVWSTGDGDLGNSGIHAFDACRMFIPGAVFPKRTLSLGGRFTYDDAAQTPNTQFTIVEYPGLPIVIENRNLSMDKEDVVMDQFRRIREGFVLQYEGGYFAGLRSGGLVSDRTGREIKRFRGDGGGDHVANFIRAIRSRKVEDLRAPIQEGQVSSGVCHLGNLSYRLAEPAGKQACVNAVEIHPFAGEGFARLAASLEGIGVDLDRMQFALGPWIETDALSGEILQGASGSVTSLERARQLARGAYRAPFVPPGNA